MALLLAAGLAIVEIACGANRGLVIAPVDSGSDSGSDSGTVNLPAYCDPVSGWDASLQQWEDSLLTLINDARAVGADCGTYGVLGPTTALIMEPALRCAARVHSMDMHDREFFDHVSPDGDTPEARYASAGWIGGFFDEYIACGHTTPEATLSAWMGSDPHCAHLLDPTPTLAGIGYFVGTNACIDYVTLGFAFP